MCVTKLCVKEGVWQSCMWKRVCDKAVCENYVCDKVVCERGCVWRRGGGGGGGGVSDEAAGYRTSQTSPRWTKKTPGKSRKIAAKEWMLAEEAEVASFSMVSSAPSEVGNPMISWWFPWVFEGRCNWCPVWCFCLTMVYWKNTILHTWCTENGVLKTWCTENHMF